jgi:hypothetical protein
MTVVAVPGSLRRSHPEALLILMERDSSKTVTVIQHDCIGLQILRKMCTLPPGLFIVTAGELRCSIGGCRGGRAHGSGV